MKKILITGGSGFLGGHLVQQSKKRFSVTATYFDHPYKIDGVNFTYLNLSDLNSIERSIKQIRPQVIIHTAAISSVDSCEIQKDLAHTVNFQAVRKLATLAELHGIRLIFLSSDMVYDGEKGYYQEEDAVNPINYYGETKVLAEQEIKETCSNYVIARPALIYGTAVTNANSFSDKILQNISNNISVKLFYDQYRTPILVQNLAESLLELGDHAFVGTLNLGGSQRISRYDFGLEMAQVYHFSSKLLKKCSMNDFITRAKRPRDLSLDVSKAQSLLDTKLLDCKIGIQSMMEKANSGRFNIGEG